METSAIHSSCRYTGSDIPVPAAIVMQFWNQLAILAVLLLGCVVMLFGAFWIIVFLESAIGRLFALVRG